MLQVTVLVLEPLDAVVTLLEPVAPIMPTPAGMTSAMPVFAGVREIFEAMAVDAPWLLYAPCAVRPTTQTVTLVASGMVPPLVAPVAADGTLAVPRAKPLSTGRGCRSSSARRNSSKCCARS